jgi:hypothetical protein
MADAKRQKRSHGASDERSIEGYTQWLLQRGCVLSRVQVTRDERGDDALIAKEDLDPGTTIISVPSALLLTTDVAVRSEVGTAVASHPDLRVLEDEELAQKELLDGAGEEEKLGITRRSVLYLFLISARDSLIKSSWNVYCQNLPAHFPSAFRWDDEALSIQTEEVQDEVSEHAFRCVLGFVSRSVPFNVLPPLPRSVRCCHIFADSLTASSPHFPRRTHAYFRQLSSPGIAGCGPTVHIHHGASHQNCTQPTKTNPQGLERVRKVEGIRMVSWYL